MGEARPAVKFYDVVSKGLCASRRAILLQQDVVDQLTPRNKLGEIEDMLDGYNSLCSSQSSSSVLCMSIRELQTSREKYWEARMICTDLCDITSNILTPYLEYWQEIEDVVIFDHVKAALLKLLEAAVGKLSQAGEMYKSSSSSMSVVAERISSLAGALDSEYLPGSMYYDTQRRRIQQGLYLMTGVLFAGTGSLFAAIGGAWNGFKGSVVGGCCGGVISTICSLFLVRGRIETRMEMERRDVQELYARMRRSVEEVKDSTDTIRWGMMKEVAVITGELERLQGVTVDASLSDDTKNDLKALLTELTQICDSRSKLDTLLASQY